MVLKFNAFALKWKKRPKLSWFEHGFCFVFTLLERIIQAHSIGHISCISPPPQAVLLFMAPIGVGVSSEVLSSVLLSYSIKISESFCRTHSRPTFLYMFLLSLKTSSFNIVYLIHNSNKSLPPTHVKGTSTQI